ncbi:MAG: asparagine synthase [Deltaproteobacteria bacterium]|jgi:asparagine synthase (glutamine-hydrolysing)|nr:asparagine synthase [Deltaproteobacteria bacterium]
MCGIAGIASLESAFVPELSNSLRVMNHIQHHRGPDGEGIWIHHAGRAGLGHVRLSIIDLCTGDQPMRGKDGNWITFNGEIYNYIELRKDLGPESFQTTSDTEVILRAYEKWGETCVDKLRGMFAFAIWDEKNGKLFCARDRFGIKPFYYTLMKDRFIFASEIKALLPFAQEIATDYNGLKDYLAFQFTLGEKTLFRGINQLLPAHSLALKDGRMQVSKYWEVNYHLDWYHTKQYFTEEVRNLLMDSVWIHLRSDVPVGSYLSGGLDSSIVGSLARKAHKDGKYLAFHGKFSTGPEYDESRYARAVADYCRMELHEQDFTSQDFINSIRKVIYHLDYPVAGPGSFPQYMVSKLASEHLKVVLGGQGGDEVFGGYVRYLVSYFEQCIKGAIEGTMDSGKYVVTYESIIPNLATLREYKPLLKEFWKEGLFEERDKRYFHLVNRANGLSREINWELLEPYSAFETFKNIFWGQNVEKESYFDSMTHFDFKTLLPALLQVEDRMSMAHGLESRVPLLDHPLVEFAATIPSNIKFENGQLKHLLKICFEKDLPEVVSRRTDKMGFPVPLSDWMQGELKDFVSDIFHSQKASLREYLNPAFDIHSLIEGEGKFTRKVWGLLSLEVWQQEFHDKAAQIRSFKKGVTI